MKKERWRDVPGYQGHYRVSNWGRVKRIITVVRSKGREGIYTTQFLNPWDNGHGYWSVGLYLDGNKWTIGVHILVLLAFVGPRLEGAVCRHLDGNPKNNHVDNLCWGTHKENADDRERHGTHPHGSQSVKAKLTEEDIPTIRLLLKRKRYGTMRAIAKLYKVDIATIRDIRDGYTWQHVKGIAKEYNGPPLQYGEHWKGGSKGRGPKGDTHPFAKMDAEKVKKARDWYDTGKYTIQSLADHFHVSLATMFAIVKRKSWKEVS